MIEPFSDCSRCYLGERNETDRAYYRCAHPTFDERLWAPANEGVIAVHMGAPSKWDADGFPDEKPIESNEDGCPGAWYRCSFFWSLQKYLRHSEQENPLLSRCSDRLVLEAVACFDYHHSRSQRID